jgi:hypothetical protein
VGEQGELEAMPARWVPRVVRAGGRTRVFHGPFVIFDVADGDVGMRNFVLVALTESEVCSVKQAAELFGVRPELVSRLRGDYARSGPAALAPKRPGRPARLSPAQVEQAREWARRRVSHAEIGKRLGVARSVVTETLRRHGGPAAEPAGLFDLDDEDGDDEDGDGEDGDACPDGNPAGMSGLDDELGEDLAGDDDGNEGGVPGAGLVPAGARVGEGVFPTKFAAAMLVHAYLHRMGVREVLERAAAAAPAGPARRAYDNLGVLTAVLVAFTLGYTSIERFKYLPAADAGPLAGWDRLPCLRALRPLLAGIADACDPVGLLAGYFGAVLAADPGSSRVFYVDDHFIGYAGGRPVGKGWNNKRGRAERGRFDTLVVDRGGRAVGFATGEPSGLSVTLPPALARLRRAAGGREILLGFDRGGAYPAVFTKIRAHGTHWVTYRRAPLAPTTHLPVLSAPLARSGTKTPVAFADELVRLDGYHNGGQTADTGVCRQVTVFEHGTPVLQVLTSDLTSCALALLKDLIGRWGIENRLKYDAEHYGTDLICDYTFTLVDDDRVVDNPERKKANTAVAAARAAVDTARAAYAAMLADFTIGVDDKNHTLVPSHQQAVARAEQALAAAETARDTVPARVPANVARPGARRALHRASRRMLQMLLRLVAANAEQWLARQLNTTLRDGDEYRSLTRHLLRGHDGTLTYTPQAITVELARPASPRLATALDHLLAQLATDPPRLPGDPRPITYTLAR